MRCPKCDFSEDRVLESRQNATATAIRRRRECLSCAYRFTSYERIEEKALFVIKRNGRREPFDLRKIAQGLTRSLVKRPVSTEQTETVLHKIEDQAVMLGRDSREIDSRSIGELVLKQLYVLDKVAYIRFASVYRQYDNVGQFINEIKGFSETNR